jgi:excisionase family DNA binding protein
MATSPAYYTYHTAAQRLALSARMIRKLVAARQIKARKIGKSVRIPAHELARFEAALPIR